MYNPNLGRFFSVDPIGKKFPMLSPYQFASNTPIWAVDLDGLEARVYSDLSRLPHSFISVIDAEGVINVYTYGQYGEGLPEGEAAPFAKEGALVHLRGDAANEYIKHEFDMYGDNLQVFELSDKIIDKQAVIDYYATEMKNYNIPATGWREEVKLASKYPGDGSKAVKYKPYWLIPDEHYTENCTSTVLDALRAGGEKSVSNQWIGSLAIPWDLHWSMKTNSWFSNNYRNVTSDAKTKANNNINGTPKKIKSSGSSKSKGGKSQDLNYSKVDKSGKVNK